MRPAWRDIAAPLLAIAIVAAAATLAAGLHFFPWGLAILVAGAAAAVGIVVGSAGERSARIARINVEARRLLSPEHRAPRQAADTLGRPETDRAEDDVALLRQTLSQLGTRMSAQVKEVAKKTRNLEALLDAIHDPLVVTDASDEVLLANSAMLRFAGVSTLAHPATEPPAVGGAGGGGGGGGTGGGTSGGGGGAIIGRPIRGLFTRPEVLAVHARARAGQPAQGRAAMTTEDGPRIFDVSAKPLPNAWGEGVFGVLLILRDITELAQSVQVQKDFVANASHELRTPVAAIRMAAETLDGGAADEPAMRARLLKTIADHADRLEETIRDLMDLSRTDPAAMTATLAPTDLRAIADALRPTFDPLLSERHVSLSVEIDDAAARPSSDARLLSLILRNLVENAAKHARPHTTVRVTARRTPGDRVRIEVIDKGTGIPLAHQDRVWERFYQIDPARTGVTGRRGTGLGLAIVRQAVTALNGDCGLESVWGEGTTVWVELPER